MGRKKGRVRQKIELSQQLEQWHVSSTINHHQVESWVGEKGGFIAVTSFPQKGLGFG